MSADTTERKLAAIFSADVVGYSRLMAEDEDSTVRTLTEYRDAIERLVGDHRGRVVDFTGDNLLADFPSATEAVSCAVQTQEVLKVRNDTLPPDHRMEFRIGVHVGEVRIEGKRLYGDGVNIAARLEGLANPGGICISDMVHKQVRNKLELVYDDLGQQEVKNIPEPVHVYRIRLTPEESNADETLPGMEDLTVPGFAGRPAIAVLPFDNLSGDPEQTYFSDGIAEDLITRLSSWRWFPVIARNSTFVYKGKTVDIRRVSRELGARYVVEGSVRKVGDRVRISAQLIDATTGHHVWAERYDRELKDIFALQDEITEAIAAAMNPELLQFETERTVRREPSNLDAWECAHRGWWHLFQRTEDRNAKARSFYEEAIRLDPQFVWAHYGLAVTHLNDLLDGVAESPDRSVAEIVKAARTCIALDDKDPFGHVALGLAYSLTGQRAEMLAALRLAVQLNPSLASGYRWLGLYLAMVGESDEAIAALERGMRLSPQDPQMWHFLFGMALAYSAAGRSEDGVRWAQRSLQRRPSSVGAYALLAVNLTRLDRLEEARMAGREILRLNPAFSLASMKRLLSAADPAFVEGTIADLRRAGFEE
jgi:TolB-like protein